MSDKTTAFFLNSSEYKEFRKKGRLVTRSMVEKPIQSQPSGNPKRGKITQVIHNELNLVNKREGKYFISYCVGVKKDDGMSWTAETVHSYVAEKMSHFKRWCIKGVKGGLEVPSIARLLGEKRFKRCAVKSKMIKGNRWLIPVIIGLCVIVGVTIELLNMLKGIAPKILNYNDFFNFLNIQNLLILGGTVSLGLIFKYLLDLLSKNSKTNKYMEFIESLSQGTGKCTNEFYDFIERLAHEIEVIDHPLFVIIDDFDGVDYTTKEVIKRYFDRHSEISRTSTFWVIFEHINPDTDKFSNWVIENPNAYGFQRTQLFEQVLLEDDEKLELSKNIGKPERVHFTTVKRICHDDKEAINKYAELFNDFRVKHPKNENQYSNLDFLFLLSLTSLPDSYNFSRRELINKLSGKTYLRSHILKRFLAGTDLNMDELRTCLGEIEQNFGAILIKEEERGQSKLRIPFEVANTLTTIADQLQLPNPRIGHLFWCIYWYNLYHPDDGKTGNEPSSSTSLENNEKFPVEAYWMRKLATHLVKCEIIDVEEYTGKIVENLFEALILTIGGCLKTCLFGFIIPLIEKGMDLLQTEYLRGTANYHRRLLRKCWEAYTVLGFEEIMGFVVNINMMTGQVVEKEETVDGDFLDRLFFELLPIEASKKENLKQHILRRRSKTAGITESISDYAKARSAWFAVTCCNYIYDLDELNLFSACKESYRCLEQLIDRSIQRIKGSSGEGIRITDIMTLSLSLWTNAFRFDYPMRIINDEQNQGKWYADKLSKMVGMAVEAVYLVSGIKEERESKKIAYVEMDLPLQAMVRELYTVTVASILAAINIIAQSTMLIMGDLMLNDIKGILAFSKDLLGFSFKPVESKEDLLSDELNNQVEGLLKVCELIWKRFDLERLCEYVKIRRAYFTAIRSNWECYNSQVYTPLCESLGPVVIKKDLTGIIGNMTLADCFRRSQEVGTFYLRNVGDIVLQQTYGRDFKREISLVIIMKSSLYSYDQSQYLRILVENGQDIKTQPFLKIYFKTKVKEDRIISYLLQILNATSDLNDSDIMKEVRVVTKSIIDEIENNEIRDEARALIEIEELRKGIKRGNPIDSERILNGWTQRKKMWVYADLLIELMSNGYCPEALLQEGVQMLDRDHLEDSYSSYLYLSRYIVQLLLSQKRNDNMIEKPRKYLEKAIQNWSWRLKVEVNINVYQLLNSYYRGSKVIYQNEAERWQNIKLYRDYFIMIPNLAQKGQYYFLFQDYYNSMFFWGLKTDLDQEELFRRLNNSINERRDIALDWKRKGSVVPDPIIDTDAGGVISGEYLCLGKYLFSAPINGDPSFDNERRIFNRMACNRINDLLDMIVELPQFPQYSKDLLRSHAKRLSEYTKPDDVRN